MKFCNLFSKLISTEGNALFDEIVGYDHIKALWSHGSRWRMNNNKNGVRETNK